MNMSRLLAPLALALPLAVHAQAAGVLQLVTPSEAVQYQGEAGWAEPASEVRMRGASPSIEITTPTPQPDLKLKAPFGIAVQFQSLPDAAIVPSTFRVLYGALKFDITSRLAKFVQLTPTGFTLERAQIPAGRHRLVLQVQDEKQRVAERELRFEVE